ncbi:MAG: hemerythrin family protein [Candidatus Marinimicrobia bacterium]|nr:hemerythrin family protein [Candidatus Neomarinimicrobiota bacterium]
MTNTLPAFITWDDSWCIGVAEIDHDHKQLVKLTQKLFGALISSQAGEHIKEIMHELIDYTRHHFNNEEKVMAAHDYPELASHKILHQDLIRQVLDVSDRILTEGESEQIGDDVFEFLKSWLVSHIINEDLRFRDFLGK